MKDADLKRFCYLLFYLVLLVFVSSNFGPGMADPDYFWHLKTGEVISEAKAIFDKDPFSYTALGQDIMHEAWLSQVIMFEVFRLDERLIIVLMSLALAGAWYFSFKSALMFLPSVPASLACAFFLAPGLLLFSTPRPQLVSFCLFAVFLHQLLSVKYRNTWRPLVILPFTMVFWVNAHGGYLVGLALLVAFSLAEGASSLAGGQKNYRRRFFWYLSVLGASIAACFINPYGVGMLLHSFDLVTSDANRQITEWHALDLNDIFGVWALITGVVFFLFTAYRRHAPDLLEIVLPSSLFLAGMTTLRYYPIASMTLIPFIAQAIGDGAIVGMLKGPLAFLSRPVDLLCGLWTAHGREAGSPPRGGSSHLPRWLAAGIVFFALTPLVLLFVWNPEKRDAKLPVLAAAFVEEKGITGRMFNSYKIGGYLLFRMYPDRRVFIDPRSGFYGDAFVMEYLKLAKAREGWRGVLDKWDIDYAILHSSEPLRRVLLLEGSFVEVHKDDSFSVFVRKDAGFDKLIEESAGLRDRDRQFRISGLDLRGHSALVHSPGR